MIELKNVCYAYGKEIALRYINLNIQKGESVIIQGPNGCGKSTLIKLLNGIIFPMEGSYTYQGHEITEKTLKDSRFAKWFHQQMGYVFQNADTQLFCGSVEEEIAFGPIQMGLSEEKVKQRTEMCIRDRNRGLPSFIWNRKTKRTPTVSFKRWRKTKSIISVHPFYESRSSYIRRTPRWTR